MTGVNTYCIASRTRLTHLIKQYNDIKGKQRHVEIDDKQPIKVEMFRLQSVFARLHKDHKAVKDLPDRIAAVADEWSQNITELDDEAAKNAANQQYEDFRQRTNWDDIQNALCDELLHHLSVLMGTCEALGEDLSVTFAQTNEIPSSASNDSSDQRASLFDRPPGNFSQNLSVDRTINFEQNEAEYHQESGDRPVVARERRTASTTASRYRQSAHQMKP
ncbi:hypothetical protein AAVH_07696 [Aphelenchoides avenae]|nr:hypothetical protein AAVH_07696 [Aphelenchus avenae]